MSRKNRFRALRNLTIAAVLLVGLWLINGTPLPTQALRMHRAERQNLVEHSQIVWRYHAGENLNDTLVGVTPTSVYTYTWNLNVWPRNPEGSTLAVLPASSSYSIEEIRVLAVDPPNGAVSARLTLTLENNHYPAEVYEAEGARDGELFLFRVTRHHTQEEDAELYRGEGDALRAFPAGSELAGRLCVPYAVEFFDGDGAVIASYDRMT